MGQADRQQQHTVKSGDMLPRIFRDEAHAEREMLHERWRQGQEADAAERAQRLRILRESITRVPDKNTLHVLRETTALQRILKLERWTLQNISQLEALIYAARDAHVSPDSPLWRGELAPPSMRLATSEEAGTYCPDSANVKATPPVDKNHATTVELANGERLVAEDAESQATLDFIRHYLQPEKDAPNAVIDFHRELRLRENYAERTEHALEAAFTMNEVAKDFAKILYYSQKTTDAKKREEFSTRADELIMDFNIQRYSLFRLLQTSHWNSAGAHLEEDRGFVQQLSRDLLIHALAEQSYALPTANELRSKEYQGVDNPTVETYFNAAYERMERVLGIRPHRDRIQEVPAVDESVLDRSQEWVH